MRRERVPIDFHDETAENALIYLPPPEKPRNFERDLERICGTNADTGKPNLRVVWGMDAKKFIGGREEVWYVDPNGIYLGMPYWIIEAWSPPTVYDPVEWEEQRYENGIDVCGPFPAHGVWDMLKILMDPNAKPEPIETAFAYAREWRHNRLRDNAKNRAVAEMIKFYHARQQRKAAAHQLLRDRVQQDLIREFEKPENTAASFASDIGDKAKRKQTLADYEITPAGLLVKPAFTTERKEN